MDRRSALRRLGGAAAAGAGLFAASAVATPEAVRAANGDPVTIGQANAGTAVTELTSNGADDDAALRVSSGDYTVGEFTFDLPALGLGTGPNGPGREADQGDLLSAITQSSAEGPDIADLYYYHTGREASASTAGRVYTSDFANFLAFGAVGGNLRIMDTRDPNKRPAGTLTGNGKLDSSLGDGTYTVDVNAAIAPSTLGLIGTLTATEAGNNGFLTLWDSGPQPEISNLNYNGQDFSTATLAMVPLHDDGTFQLATKPGRPTHVIFDIIAQIVFAPGLGGSFSGDGGGASGPARLQQQSRPASLG